MHLNRQTGSAAYGTAAVAIDGATPAALVGQVAGAQFGPFWYDTDGPRIVYQSGGTGSGPWILQSYNTSTLATATVDAAGQNTMAAGGGQWAAYLAGSGVRSSVTIASPTAPLAGAFLLDVGTNGSIAICDYQATATGITVYDTSGTAIYENPTVVVGPIARLVDDILGFQSITAFTWNGVEYPAGWHLVNVATGLVPYWFPRTDGVNWLVPFVGTDGTLYVLERTESVSLREADRSQGYDITASTGIGFNPDGLEISAGVCRAGYCTDLGESVTSVVLYDVTMASGVTSVGTVSGGAIVFAAGPTLTATTFPVGPAEGTALATATLPPIVHPVVDKRTGDRVTQPWQEYFNQRDRTIGAMGAAIQRIPNPPAAPPPSFGNIAGDVSPNVAATTASDTLNLTSDDASVTFASNPITKTVDLSVAFPPPPSIPIPRRVDDRTRVVMIGSQQDAVTSSVCFVPVSSGAEPLQILSNGAGLVLLTPYTP